jgi:hypothetical protein
MVAVVVVVFAERPSVESGEVESWNGGATVEEAEERALARPLLDWH